MLHIGILGAAGIAPQSIIRPAARAPELASIVAVASRRADAAADYAERWGIHRAFGSYEQLLADPEVDLVYNALPPSEHARWTIAALEAGKDVLCEKPFAMTAAEAEAVVATTRRTGRRAIEAFHDSYHPLSAAIRQTAEARLGGIREITATFAVNNPYDPRSIRHDPAVGGGALMDLGCYPVHWIRALTGLEPEVVAASAVRNALGADLSIDAELRLPSGASARVVATMDSPPGTLVQSLEVTGERGTLTARGLVFPHQGHSIRTVVDGLSRSLTVAGEESYDHQLRAVAEGLASGRPLPTEEADPIANMRVIDAIYAAAGVR